MSRSRSRSKKQRRSKFSTRKSPTRPPSDERRHMYMKELYKNLDNDDLNELLRHTKKKPTMKERIFGKFMFI